MKENICYFDSAATAYYRPPQVAQAVADAIRTMGNSSRGTHPAALESARVIYETRELLAELFDAQGPEQIAFTANSTESLNLAIQGILEPGDRVVTTILEHNSVLRPLYEMERRGAGLVVVGCDGLGHLDYDAMEQAITSGTRAVVVNHASNLTGNLMDIGRIGRACHRAGAILVVDASQTAGIFPISMERDGIDILCFTGHKGLMGPQGTGGICVRKGLSIRPLLRGGSGILTFSKEHPKVMPAMLEAGTLNGHGIAGLRAALLYIRQYGMDRIREREQKLAEQFVQGVREIPGIRLYGDYEKQERAAIVALNLGNEDSGEVSDWLAEERQIYTRFGGHCAPLLHEHFRTVGQGMVRFSFSHFNTEAQVKTAVRALREYAEA